MNNRLTTIVFIAGLSAALPNLSGCASPQSQRSQTPYHFAITKEEARKEEKIEFSFPGVRAEISDDKLYFWAPGEEKDMWVPLNDGVYFMYDGVKRVLKTGWKKVTQFRIRYTDDRGAPLDDSPEIPYQLEIPSDPKRK